MFFRDTFEGSGGNAGATADIESVVEGLGATEGSQGALEDQRVERGGGTSRSLRPFRRSRRDLPFCRYRELVYIRY